MKVLTATWRYWLPPLMVCAFFHFYELGERPLDGDESLDSTAAIWFLHGIDHPKYFGSLFLFQQPPIRVLLPAFTYPITGVNEFTTRIFHAIFGILTLFPVFFTARMLNNDGKYGNYMGSIAAWLYAVAGIVGMSRLAMGISPFFFFTTLALYHTVASIQSENLFSARRQIFWFSIALTLAFYSYMESGLLLLGAVWLFHRRWGWEGWKCGAWKSFWPLVTGVFVFFLLWGVLPQIAARAGYVKKPGTQGNLGHLLGRFTHLSGEPVSVIKSIIGTIGFPLAIILFASVLWILYRWIRQKRSDSGLPPPASWPLILCAPHLLIWTFLLNQAVEHPLFHAPFIFIACSPILVEMMGRYRWTIGLGVILIITAALHTWGSYLAHWPDKTLNALGSYPAWVTGHPLHLEGSERAAGLLLRAISTDPSDEVFTAGAETTTYYAGRIQRRYPVADTLESPRPLTREDFGPVKYAVIKRDAWPHIEGYLDREAEWSIWIGENPPLAVYGFSGSASPDRFVSSTPPGQTPKEVVETNYLRNLIQKDYGRWSWREAAPYFALMAAKRMQEVEKQ